MLTIYSPMNSLIHILLTIYHPFYSFMPILDSCQFLTIHHLLHSLIPIPLTIHPLLHSFIAILLNIHSLFLFINSHSPNHSSQLLYSCYSHPPNHSSSILFLYSHPPKPFILFYIILDSHLPNPSSSIYSYLVVPILPSSHLSIIYSISQDSHLAILTIHHLFFFSRFPSWHLLNYSSSILYLKNSILPSS